MISLELADPSDFFFKYRKSLFSIVLSLLTYFLFITIPHIPKQKKALGRDL